LVSLELHWAYRQCALVIVWQMPLRSGFLKNTQKRVGFAPQVPTSTFQEGPTKSSIANTQAFTKKICVKFHWISQILYTNKNTSQQLGNNSLFCHCNESYGCQRIDNHQLDYYITLVVFVKFKRVCIYRMAKPKKNNWLDWEKHLLLDQDLFDQYLNCHLAGH